MNIVGIILGIVLLCIGFSGAIVNLIRDNNINESPDFSGLITFGLIILAMGICL